MKNKLILAIGILTIIALILSVINFSKINNSEWVCIAQECKEYAEGDDWVKQNCKLKGKKMMCEFQYDGQNFNVPLSGINVSNMISCKEYTCSSKVLILKLNNVGGKT